MLEKEENLKLEIYKHEVFSDPCVYVELHILSNKAGYVHLNWFDTSKAVDWRRTFTEIEHVHVIYITDPTAYMIFESVGFQGNLCILLVTVRN